MRYFTSDLHIGDKLIARWRGFEDLASHDEMVLSRLEEALSAEDELWLLGDVGKANVGVLQKVRERIPCTKVYVVLGNHDTRSKFESAGGFARVEYYDQVGKVAREGYKFVMSHYPMLDWDRKMDGSYMLHGHIHSLPASSFYAPGAKNPHGKGRYGYNEQNRAEQVRRFDVGVDANDYRPVSDVEIVEFFAE